MSMVGLDTVYAGVTDNKLESLGGVQDFEVFLSCHSVRPSFGEQWGPEEDVLARQWHGCKCALGKYLSSYGEKLKRTTLETKDNIMSD